jgi:hypothetical protein
MRLARPGIAFAVTALSWHRVETTGRSGRSGDDDDSTEPEPMAQNLATEAIKCYERARLARERAGSTTDKFKADFVAAERRWLILAETYEHLHRLSSMAGFDRLRKAGAITRTLLEQGVALDPDDVTKLEVAYYAVIRHVGLVQHEEVATRLLARRIVQLASEGQRDPERLMAAAIKALSK